MAGSGGPVFLPVPDLGLTPTLPHHGLGGGLPGRKAGALHVGCPRPPTVAAPSAPLPHVEQYEVVWPQRLPGPRARRALSPQAVSLAWKLVGDGASLPGPAERAGGRLMPPVCPAACEGPVWGLRARRASVLVRGPLGRAPLEAPFPPPGLSFLRPPPPPAGRAPGAATPADHGCPRTASWDPRRPGHSPVSLRFLLRLARGGSAGPVAPFAGASWDFPELPGASLKPTECARVQGACERVCLGAAPTQARGVRSRLSRGWGRQGGREPRGLLGVGTQHWGSRPPPPPLLPLPCFLGKGQHRHYPGVG